VSSFKPQPNHAKRRYQMDIHNERFVGLNKWALDFVKSDSAFFRFEARTHIYPKGQQERLNILPIYNSSIKKEESGTFYHGMWNKRPLYKYIFPDGRMYFEKLQEAIWSSGPVLFTALVDESGRWVPESLWTEEGIKA